jgi:hypothetical protein
MEKGASGSAEAGDQQRTPDRNLRDFGVSRDIPGSAEVGKDADE